MIEADGYSGGIIFIWQNHIGMVSLVVNYNRALHLVISTGFSEDWILSVVYNSTRIQGHW